MAKLIDYSKKPLKVCKSYEQFKYSLRSLQDKNLLFNNIIVNTKNKRIVGYVDSGTWYIEINIPPEVKGAEPVFCRDVRAYQVKLICHNKNFDTSHMFTSCERLLNIDMSECDFKCIGKYMFYGCVNLMQIELPSGVSKIGEHAFERCRKLVSLYIPDSIMTIGNSAFAHCDRLDFVRLPRFLKVLETAVFSKCINLRNIQIPEGLEEFGHRVFYSCFRLQTVLIPTTVKAIYYDAFERCYALKIVFPNNKGVFTVDEFDTIRSDLIKGYRIYTLRTFEDYKTEEKLQRRKIDL